MSQLKLYTGNRLEILADSLAEFLSEPLPSPLTREVIVVQSSGMERWVAMRLAEIHGVCANCRFPFPNAIIAEAFTAFLPGLTIDRRFDPGVLTWRIMGLLQRIADRPSCAEIGHYLGEGDELKRFQLAARIADTFDQYTVFRPELLLAWEEGEESHWQAELWRELTTAGGLHRARLRRELAGVPPRMAAGLPLRLSVFGIPALPPMHLEVFRKLSQSIDVALFCMNPCRQYWGDICTPREISHGGEEEYRSEGNPLLSSMGRLGRDFFDLLLDLGAEEEGRFSEPGYGNLLSSLQSDILDLVQRGVDEPKLPLDPRDRSLAVHSCHSPMRELEVLHDQLLMLFKELPGLEPRDILVMTPDIEAYAPFIAAVFDGSRDRRIPYSIADRGARGQSRLASDLLAVLGLPGSRFTVTQVLDLLESEAVRRRFGLELEDLALIRRWTEGARVRWGIDERHREKSGVPPFRENSWEAARERLLAGYALPEDEGLFAGILPLDLEGSECRTAGKFLEFLERLFSAVERLESRHSPPAWGALLIEIIDSLLLADEEKGDERSRLVRHCTELSEQASLAEYDGETGLDTVRAWITARLEKERPAGGFLTGEVTFCAMLPMRSIPFRVIALIGMNDGAYPRSPASPGFDLIARNPRRGDRSRRDEDRYLFLEALLSARERFYLSYVGQSVRDNSESPPSVLVSELLDCVERGFAPPEGKTVADILVTHHRLQPFSPHYFTPDGPLFSFRQEECAAIADRLSGLSEPPPFAEGELPSAETAETLELRELASFFSNPSRSFLERRLGMRMEAEEELPEETEPFELAGLDRYRLAADLTAEALSGGDPADDLPLARGNGMLPPGVMGEVQFADLCRSVNEFAVQVAGRTVEEKLEPVEIDLRIGNRRLVGRLQGLYPSGLVRFRPASVKARDFLYCWIEHLALCAASPAGCDRRSTLIGIDRTVEFSAVEGAEDLLTRLVALLEAGLRDPLPFFPATSWELVQREKKGDDPEKARQGAMRVWEGNDRIRGEGCDPSFSLCFRGHDPFGPCFSEVSRAVFAPLAAAAAET